MHGRSSVHQTRGSHYRPGQPPGLASASVTIAAKPVTLRKQTPVWEREVPVGDGITGLWRPCREAEAGLQATLFGGANNSVFTLRQNSGTITGQVESPSGFFGGGGTAVIENGHIEAGKISFRAGTTTYSGKVNGDKLELQKSASQIPGGLFKPPAVSTAPRPAIGPPPDGTDLSFDMGGFGAHAAPPIILRRATREYPVATSPLAKLGEAMIHS